MEDSVAVSVREVGDDRDRLPEDEPAVVDAGIVPFGFIARNQGSSTLPQGSAPLEMWPSGPIVPLARVSSNSTPTSTKAQSTRLVQIEFGRPQILIMLMPRFECCR